MNLICEPLKKLVALSSIAIAGCTVAPNYEAPSNPLQTPDAWHFASLNSFAVGSVDVANWWYRFDDPQLVALISEAQQQNLTLQVAVSNLLQARATYGIASSALSPTVGLQGYAEREQASDNSPTLSNFPNVEASPIDDFAVGLDSSWEIDLWGGIAKNIEASSAMEGVALENYRDALITLRSEVATSYINIRMLQITKALTTQSIETLPELLVLIEAQY